MISTARKANADQRDKSSKEIAPAGKAVWHRPVVWRLETVMETQTGSGQGYDLEHGASTP